MVNLGQKIIGKHHSDLIKGTDRLAKFDVFGKTMLFIQMFSLLASTVVLVVLSPILTDAELVLSRLGFGFKGVFVWFCLFGYVHQYQRCIKAIKSAQKSAENIIQSQRKDDLIQVVVRLRKSQMIQLLSGGPSALLFTLLAFGAIDASVWAALGSQALEALGAIYYEFIVRKRSNPQRVTESSSTHAKNNVLTAAKTEIVLSENPS
jgi:hypothetical protein